MSDQYKDEKAKEEQKGEKKTFKVIDRRRFDEDGGERTGPDVVKEDRPSPAVPVAAAPPQAGAAPPPDAAPAKKTKPEPASGLTFLVFVQSLAQQALMQLGLIPWPHGQRELHIDQARDTIDILSLLKTKTTNNLTPEENTYLERALHELRMGAVEVEQAIARSRGGMMPPPPMK
jgi:hypothetical protein